MSISTVPGPGVRGLRHRLAGRGSAALATAALLAAVTGTAMGGTAVAGGGPVRTTGRAGSTTARTTSSTAAFATTPLFADQFGGTAIDRTNWAVYDNGRPPDRHTARNVVVGNGYLSLRTAVDPATHAWSTAGICLCQHPAFFQTYGKYEMRARFSAGDSRVVALLWPDVGWPPEIDWVEMGADGAAGNRQEAHQNLHYGHANSIVHTKYLADMTAWHTIGLEWSPGLVQYTLDGVVRNRVVSANVSNQMMWMGLSTHPDKKAVPTRNAEFDLDWMQVFAYTGGSATAPAAPAGVVAQPGDTSARVNWTAPASDGNSPVTDYTIKASPGGATTTVSYSGLSDAPTSTSFAGLTPGVDYSFTVTARNSFGTSPASAPSAPVTVSGTPPAITSGPDVHFRAHTTVGSTPTASDIPLSLSWTAAPGGGSPIASSVPQRSVNGGPMADLPWFRWAPLVAKDSLTGSGDEVSYRVQAVGQDALRSPWAVGPNLRYTLRQEGDPTISYAGAWTSTSCSTCSRAGSRSTVAKGASATVTVTGARQVGIVAPTGPGLGAVTVSVDGGPATTLWTNSATAHPRQLIYTTSWPVAGSHTLKLVNVASSGHPRFDLDAVMVLGS